MVLLDTPSPGVTATPNEHNIRFIPHLRVGDRIKAEGLMTVRCGIENDKRGKPHATMWLTLKIREDWTFLGNPSEDNESSEGSEESDDGKSDGDGSRSSGSNANESSCDDEGSSSSDGGSAKVFNPKEVAKKKLMRRIETPKCLRAKSYSGPARRAKGEDEAKIGDKRVFFENKSERTGMNRGANDKNGAKVCQSTIVHHKRARTRIFVDCDDAVSVSFRGDVFDYLAKDKELQQKKVDASEGTSTVPSRTKEEHKERFSNTEELDGIEDPVDKDENEDEDKHSSESNEDDTRPKQTKLRASATAMSTAKVTSSATTPPLSGVDTNATAQVETGKTKTTTTIVTNTVLTTATTPSVHAVTAAAAMAMSTSVTKTMATIRKHQKKTASSKLKK
jgi:hypothetical protein